ncbi:MAG: alpha-D-glucose phosphate-specific phosphoglucomutase [Actinomycetaceae bacterium]|nr:alpha-D-glucose phosphate-specific phosphoglucomutase [Actinomycetaceae bacterium]
MAHERAGMQALPSQLINVDALIDAYYSYVPDASIEEQSVVFGTSGHRGSSLDYAFNEAHIIAITKAIIEYRTSQGIVGPLFIGRDTHALSLPAERTAVEVLAAHDVRVYIDARNSYTPTPAVSVAILNANGAPGKVRTEGDCADGIVITPSHNPPRDGGFKYNAPTGGPADVDATSAIAKHANELLITGQWKSVKRIPYEKACTCDHVHGFDFLKNYVEQLSDVCDMEAIASSSVRIGADPLGGASLDYWGAIAERYALNIEVVNNSVDPRFAFMPLDHDGKIRMDCSSVYAMSGLVKQMELGNFDIATGNDPDSDRHGIVTVDGLMNPNHYLAVAIDYLVRHRLQWKEKMGIGKTLVSSSLIDRVVAGLGRSLYEVPVGFKWFVDGLLKGDLAFGGEESAGASFQRFDGSVWSTDKDGIIMDLLASEIIATQGISPSQYYMNLVEKYGESAYARIDAPATPVQKKLLKSLDAGVLTQTTLAGNDIVHSSTVASGNGQAIGGVKVETEDAWFAARPSGTENVYKIYAESFQGSEHLKRVQAEAQDMVDLIVRQA